MTHLEGPSRGLRGWHLGILVCAGIAVITLASCTNRPGAGTEVVVTESDDGDSVEIPESGILVVELETNPSTGFRWELAEADPDAVELLGRPRIEQPDTEALGAPGVEVWRFKALTESASELAFEYARPFERPGRDARTFEIEVGVHKVDAELPPLHLHEEQDHGAQDGEHETEDDGHSETEDSESGNDSHG